MSMKLVVVLSCDWMFFAFFDKKKKNTNNNDNNLGKQVIDFC